MKINNLTLNLTKKDILDLLTFQDKVTINELTLNDKINIKGIYKVVAMNIDFECELVLKGYKNNVVNIEINNLLINRKNSSNTLVKGTISIISKSVNDIDGFNLNDNLLEIDIENCVESYCTENYGIKLDNLQIGNVRIKNNEIELEVKTIETSIIPQPPKKKKKK